MGEEQALPNVVLAARAIDQLEEQKLDISKPELDSIGKLIKRLESEGEVELVSLIHDRLTLSNPNQQQKKHSDSIYKMLLILLLLVSYGIFYLLWKSSNDQPAQVAKLPSLELKPILRPNLVFKTVEPELKPMVEVVNAPVETVAQDAPVAKTDKNVVDTSMPLEPETVKEVIESPEVKDEQKVVAKGIDDSTPIVNGFPQNDNTATKNKRVFYVRIASKVYRYPEYGAPKIGYLNRDDEVKIVSDLGEWVKIRSDYADGYVPADILESDKP